MKIKKSNKVLLFLATILLAGAIVTDYLLALSYKSINLQNPLRNFESISIRPFKTLKVSGGNAYSVELRRGDSFAIQLLSSRKSFFKLKQEGDSLVIQFSVAARTANQSYDPVKGLIIYAPGVRDAEFSGTNSLVTGFSQDSLVLTQSTRSKTIIEDLHIGTLTLQSDGESLYDCKKNNEAKNLIIGLKNNAVALLNGIRFQSIHPMIGETAAIVLGSSNFQNGVTVQPAH